jgi:hypothetical protein
VTEEERETESSNRFMAKLVVTFAVLLFAFPIYTIGRLF